MMKKCNWPKGTICNGMKSACQSGRVWARLTINLETFKERTFYCVKNGAKDKTGLAFNFCPWCGAKTNHEWCHQRKRKDGA